jgi:hypothetical protein
VVSSPTLQQAWRDSGAFSGTPSTSSALRSPFLRSASLGLVLGQKLQEWLLTEGLKDKSEVMFNVLWVEFKRGFVLKSISLGSAGVLVKATMEFVSLVPTLVTPVWQGFRQRFAFKLVGWDELVVPLITLTLTQWRTLTALSLATASLKVTLMEYRRGRIR